MRLTSTPARITALFCCAEVLSMTAFSGFAALLPVLAAEFGLNNSQAGIISGIVLGGYMAGVPFLGSLTDRMDARRVYAGAAVAAASGALGRGPVAKPRGSDLRRGVRRRHQRFADPVRRHRR